MAKMRITYHNGRANKQGVYSSKHNDRNFDIKTAEHIEPSKAEKNIYWHWCQKSEPKLNFEQSELKYYNEHFNNYLTERNNKSIKQGHKERVQSITDYHKSRKSCPEETIYQVGNIQASISKETFEKIFAVYLAWQKEQYPQVVVLNWAYHGDEQGAGHIHTRQVWVAHDIAGREMVNQGETLREMGVERPETDKKEGRYNNAKMTYTQKSREKFVAICHEHGIEIETEPKDASKTGKDLKQWQAEQDKRKTEEAKAEIQKAVEEHEEVLAEIARAEMYLSEINAEAEAEKKKAEEYKASAEAENKRIENLRVADAERKQHLEVEEKEAKQRLQDLKNEADKEKARANKNKKRADNAESRAEEQENFVKNLEVIEKIRKENIVKLKAKQAEAEKQLELENAKLIELQDADAERTKRLDVLEVEENALKQGLVDLQNKKKQIKKDVERENAIIAEIRQEKAESINIISKIAEPILAVSSAIKNNDKNKLLSTVRNLVQKFKRELADDIPRLKIFVENHELIENQEFDKAYQNILNASTDTDPNERGLNFILSVVRIHGTTDKIIVEAVEAVTKAENESPAFTAKLLQNVIKSEEYQKAFRGGGSGYGSGYGGSGR